MRCTPNLSRNWSDTVNMANYEHLFKEYEKLAARADQAFNAVQKEHEPCVKCEAGCSDCCHAVFGLFPIESMYLNHHFGDLNEAIKQQAFKQGEIADGELLDMQKQLEECGDDHAGMNRVMAQTRVRCPLLTDEHKCLIYDRRPVTCRVYGIPTRVGGQARACWKAGFESGKTYPVFDLDGVYRELYRLSGEALKLAGEEDPEKAGLLVSVSRAIK